MALRFQLLLLSLHFCSALLPSALRSRASPPFLRSRSCVATLDDTWSRRDRHSFQDTDAVPKRRKGFVARRNEGRFASEPREGSKKRKKQGYVDKTRPPQSPSTSPDVILANAKAALAAASDSVDVEFVGCVMRASRVLEFKVWIDAECGIEGEKMGEASTALRDALWEAVPGRPAISVQTPGRTRPLFSAEDFVRFAGQRAQVTLKTASHGRKRLLGELLGVEREARRTRLDAPAGGTDFEVEDIVYIVVHDEHVDAPVRAPLSAIQLGEKTALAPLNAQSGPLALGKPRRGGKTEGDVAAKAFVDAEVRLAPVVVFLKSYCPYCRRALKVLRECGLDTDDERLRLVQLENREDMVAVQQHLKQRTGASTVPRIFIGEESIGGAEDLEALRDRQGFLEARLMIASSEHEERVARSLRVEKAARGQL